MESGWKKLFNLLVAYTQIYKSLCQSVHWLVGWLVRQNKDRLLYKLKNLHQYSLDIDTRKRFGVKIFFYKCVSWNIFTFLAFLLSSNSKILYFQYNSLTLWKFIELTMKMISGATLRISRYVHKIAILNIIVIFS